MGWILLAGFLLYWFLIKGATVGSLVSTVQNELSGFSAVPAAGTGQGSVTDPGSHASSPGAVSIPLGHPSASGGSQLPYGPAVLPVQATTPLTGQVPVGVLGTRNQIKRPLVPIIRTVGMVQGHPVGVVKTNMGGVTLG